MVYLICSLARGKYVLLELEFYVKANFFDTDSICRMSVTATMGTEILRPLE